ncbi:MAG: hypothetical protein AMXMBFR25_30410 [Lysobacterales bacterium]
MSADSRSLRNRWSEFFGTLRTRISAAFAVGLPADDARAAVEPGAGQEGDDGLGPARSTARDPARRLRDDAPGYMTRNGLGSLEVGAFRDRTGD